MQEDTELAKEGSFNIIAFSQGVLIARRVLSFCEGIKATPRAFISIGGPNMGVTSVPFCVGSSSSICSIFNAATYQLSRLLSLEYMLAPAAYFSRVGGGWEEGEQQDLHMPRFLE